MRAAHFVFIPFAPPSSQEIAENNITLSDAQKVAEQRYTELTTIGMGYFIEQTTKVCRDIPSIILGYSHSTLQPNDIGLALYDNPVGQLAWMGTTFKHCAHPVYILLKQLTPRIQ